MPRVILNVNLKNTSELAQGKISVYYRYRYPDYFNLVYILLNIEIKKVGDLGLQNNL